jgi:hypothetical protein
MIGANAVIVISEIGVTDATASHFDNDLICLQRRRIERSLDERLALSRHHPANWGL